LKIGLVIYDSLDQMTGGYRYDRQLVQNLSARGDDVVVYSLPWRSYGSRLTDNLSRTLDRWLEAEAPDILLQDELNHPSLVLANNRLRGARIPIVGIVHHLRASESWGPVAGRFYRFIERRYLRTLDGMICNSQRTREAAQALAHVPIPNIVAWPGAEGPPQLTPGQVRARARQPGPLQVVYLGAIIRRKGLDVLLRALACLPQGTAQLTVIGSELAEPIFASQVRRLRQRLGNRVEVTWLGSAPEARVAQAMSAAHVLAVPSRHEGFGMAYLEAMGYGLVPLAAASGGASDLIENGLNGYLIRAGDFRGLASRLELLQTGREDLAKLGCQALKRYRSHPTWERIGKQVAAFLRSINPSVPQGRKVWRPSGDTTSRGRVAS
jgi:glycosyltransferase involved in cell wall biosynthesis